MDPVRPVLVASDLSEASRDALAAGARIAALLDAPLVVAHGVRSQPLSFLRSDPTPKDGSEPITRARDALARHVTEVLGPAIHPELHVAVGTPSRIVADLAESLAAEVIVLGAHRPRGPLDGLVGTTADRVARLATRPCLLMNAPLVLPLGAVLVPTDFSAVARAAVTLAARWLARRAPHASPTSRPRLRLLHIGDPVATPNARAASRRLLDQEVARAQSLLATAGVIVEGQTSLQPVPIDAIAAAADAMPADLVVLGTHGWSGVARLLLGSVTGAAVRTLRRPLVVVPPPPGEDS